MDLPPDLANGMLMTLISNVKPSAPKTVVSMLVAFHGVRLIHLEITPSRTVPFSVGGARRKAQEFTMKIDLGGLVGVVAPVIGKQPQDVHFLLLEDVAPAFVREDGQFFEDGPVWRIDQVGPVTH